MGTRRSGESSDSVQCQQSVDIVDSYVPRLISRKSMAKLIALIDSTTNTTIVRDGVQIQFAVSGSGHI